MYTAMDEINLVSDLIYILGFNVNQTDNILLDQETNTPVTFEGKNIKVTRNPAKPAYISDKDIKLEPANPKCTKLMNRLLGFFLNREHKYGNIPNVVSYYLDDVDKELGTAKTVIKFEDGSYFESDVFRNKAIAYTDAIMKIDGSFVNDLSIFDIDEDVIVN